MSLGGRWLGHGVRLGIPAWWGAVIQHLRWSPDIQWTFRLVRALAEHGDGRVIETWRHGMVATVEWEVSGLELGWRRHMRRAPVPGGNILMSVQLRLLLLLLLLL